MFPFDGAPGGVVPVLGWAVWPRGCGCITFSLLCLNPRPAGVRPGSQATDVGLSAGGVTAPGGAGSSVLLGRNAGKQRPFQHHLGRQQVPGTSTGIPAGLASTLGFLPKGSPAASFQPCRVLEEGSREQRLGWWGGRGSRESSVTLQGSICQQGALPIPHLQLQAFPLLPIQALPAAPAPGLTLL